MSSVFTTIFVLRANLGDAFTSLRQQCDNKSSLEISFFVEIKNLEIQINYSRRFNNRNNEMLWREFNGKCFVAGVTCRGADALTMMM